MKGILTTLIPTVTGLIGAAVGMFAITFLMKSNGEVPGSEHAAIAMMLGMVIGILAPAYIWNRVKPFRGRNSG